MPQDVNTDIQIARYWNQEAFDDNWLGIPIELGGRGRLVQLWGVHYYIVDIPTSEGFSIWANALSSNPEHQGVTGLGVPEFLSSKALYGVSFIPTQFLIAGLAGATIHSKHTEIIPLYGLIRPRRQIWVIYRSGHITSGFGFGMELYYSELPMPRQDVITANRKHGKYRRT